MPSQLVAFSSKSHQIFLHHLLCVCPPSPNLQKCVDLSSLDLSSLDLSLSLPSLESLKLATETGATSKYALELIPELCSDWTRASFSQPREISPVAYILGHGVVFVQSPTRRNKSGIAALLLLMATRGCTVGLFIMLMLP